MTEPTSKQTWLILAAMMIAYVILNAFLNAAREPLPMPETKRWLLLAPVLTAILLGAAALVFWPRVVVSPVPINHYGSHLDPHPRWRLVFKLAMTAQLAGLTAGLLKWVANGAVEASSSDPTGTPTGSTFELIASKSDILAAGLPLGTFVWLVVMFVGYRRRERIRNDPTLNIDDPFRTNWLR